MRPKGKKTLNRRASKTIRRDSHKQKLKRVFFGGDHAWFGEEALWKRQYDEKNANLAKLHRQKKDPLNWWSQKQERSGDQTFASKIYESYQRSSLD